MNGLDKTLQGKNATGEKKMEKLVGFYRFFFFFFATPDPSGYVAASSQTDSSMGFRKTEKKARSCYVNYSPADAINSWQPEHVILSSEEV